MFRCVLRTIPNVKDTPMHWVFFTTKKEAQHLLGLLGICGNTVCVWNVAVARIPADMDKGPKERRFPVAAVDLKASNLTINHHLGKELQFTSLTYMSASTSEASEYIRTVSMIFTGCSQPTSECRKTNFYKMQDSSHW